jgi:ribosome-associated protein
MAKKVVKKSGGKPAKKSGSTFSKSAGKPMKKGLAKGGKASAKPSFKGAKPHSKLVKKSKPAAPAKKAKGKAQAAKSKPAAKAAPAKKVIAAKSVAPAAAKAAPQRRPRKITKAERNAGGALPLQTEAQLRAELADAEVVPQTGVTLENAKKISPEKSEAFAIEVAQLVRDDKCEDVVVLDVRGKSPVTDYIVIGSGTSDRQMRSVLNHVEDLAATQGNQCVRRSIDERATWILADFVDVVVHLFEPNTRAHYDLEMLWGDAKKVAWERPDQLSRDYAGLNS